MDTVVFVHWALFTLHLHANPVFNQIAVNVIPFSVLVVKVDTSCKIIPVKLANQIVKLASQPLSVRSVKMDTFMILSQCFVLTSLNKEEAFTMLLTPL